MTRRTFAFCLLILLLLVGSSPGRSAFTAAPTVDPPAWTVGRIDLSGGPVTVNVTTSVLCPAESTCVIALFWLSANGSGSVVGAYKWNGSVEVVVRNGVVPSSLLQPVINIDDSETTLLLAWNGELTASELGPWVAFATLIDSNGTGFSTETKVLPVESLSQHISGPVVHTMWFDDLTPAADVSASGVFRTGLEYFGVMEASDGFVGLFVPHMQLDATIGAQFSGPAGSGTSCHLAVSQTYPFCDKDLWTGMGPQGTWRVHIFSSASVARNWPLLVWADASLHL